MSPKFVFTKLKFQNVIKRYIKSLKMLLQHTLTVKIKPLP